VRLLADAYRSRLHGGRLADLPARPRFVFCATDLVFGVNWIFDRERMGDYQAGYGSSADWPVAEAVAASSCFPPVFGPLPIRFPPDALRGGAFRDEAGNAESRDRLVARIQLTDGGVYDNLGLEPVWGDESPPMLLVSDGGGRLWPDPVQGGLRRLTRYTAIIQNQVVALRKRWLIDAFKAGTAKGAYWGIASAVERYGLQGATGYSKELASTRIATVRTDLDAFMPDEFEILENHGYLLADAAVRKHCPALIEPAVSPPRIPNPEWMDEGKVQTALRDSHRRFSIRRWWKGR
jgi:NTE family protein